MNYFLDTNFTEKQPILNAEESKHALRSLRLSVGDELIVGNGKGKRFRCSLAGIDDKLARLNILEVSQENSPEDRLSIAIAPTKNPSRFKWFLEKGTELGIWEVIPIICKHSERPRINEKRALKIIHAASKQSQRYFIPQMNGLTKLKDLHEPKFDHRFVAHCNPDYPRTQLAKELSQINGSVLVLIGPEGDFSQEEIDHLEEKGFVGVSLGKNRLRTETAGVYTAAIYSSSIH